MSAIIYAVANQKGGVGKTTTAVNLATSFAAVGKKVLLIDLDSQGNASTGFGIGLNERDPSMFDVLLRECEIAEAIQETMVPKLDIIPAISDLASIDVNLARKGGKDKILRNILEDVKEDYDAIFIDTPPSLGLLTVNAFIAASKVIVPLQCEFFALEGLAHLLSTISRIEKGANKNLELGGILLTMYDKRNRLTKDVEKDVRGVLKDKVYKTVIPRNVKISEAPSFGKPAIIYDYKARGAEAYLRAAKEILKKHKKYKQEEINNLKKAA